MKFKISRPSQEEGRRSGTRFDSEEGILSRLSRIMEIEKEGRLLVEKARHDRDELIRDSEEKAGRLYLQVKESGRQELLSREREEKSSLDAYREHVMRSVEEEKRSMHVRVRERRGECIDEMYDFLIKKYAGEEK